MSKPSTEEIRMSHGQVEYRARAGRLKGGSVSLKLFKKLGLTVLQHDLCRVTQIRNPNLSSCLRNCKVVYDQTA